MAIGKVKWFNNAKGYGFICPENGEEDIFVHFSSIEMDGYKTLKAGQEVYYEVNKGPKGLHALSIKATDSPENNSNQNTGDSHLADGRNSASERKSKHTKQTASLEA